MMVAFRWFLVLAFSVVADLVNPALPGALEVFAETDEAIHLSGYRRPAVAQSNDDRSAAHRAQAARAARAAAFRQRRARPTGPALVQPARKVPPRGIADPPPSPDDH